uniref:Si:ch211-199b20.3 n=1 Tax=Cyclopterus lumpus TaxID=8103 RepID=A0A8C3G4N0_CYCLU
MEDLNETDVTNGTKCESKNLPPDDIQIKEESPTKNLTSDKQDCDLKKSSSRDLTVFALQKYCGNLKPKKRLLDSPTQQQKQPDKTQHRTAIVKIRRLPFHKTQIAELQTSKFSVYLNKDCTQMSLHLQELDNNSDAPEGIISLRRTTASNGTLLDPSLAESPPKVVETLIRQEEKENSNTFTNTQLNGQISLHRQTPADSPCSDKEGSFVTSKEPDTREDGGDDFCSSMLIPCLTSTSSFQDEAQDSLRREVYLLPNSPTTGPNPSEHFDLDFLSHTNPISHNLMRQVDPTPTSEHTLAEKKAFGAPEVLCHQSLSLVYSTIDESYPEGTLQLLSDLLQPGYYPPRDITSHLLRGILLDPQCPYHLCVQAFNLLKRTQRHHMADDTTVSWDWELLTSVMADQRHPCKVVRMLLDYIVQTLEDDFEAKRSISALHHSIAKATLSCDQQFPRVREVIKWLFSAIMKSTEHGGTREAARESDELIRMVSIFQRMLSLALEVDRSPALTSAKLSQELFHMLISNIPLRAHRMLLLESLQSKLLRCKLLEHLLDYACPLKTPLPMSLSLLLHFLKYCTLAPDPSVNITLVPCFQLYLISQLLLFTDVIVLTYPISNLTLIS